MLFATIDSAAVQLQYLAAAAAAAAVWVVRLFLLMALQLQVALVVNEVVDALDDDEERVEVDYCTFPMEFEIPLACKFPHYSAASTLETHSVFSFPVPSVTQRHVPSVLVVPRVDLATIVESVADFEQRLDSTCFRTIEHMS